MFKCYDKVVGEIVECDNKKIFLEEINDRFTYYKQEYENARCYFTNGIYYLVCGNRRLYPLQPRY